MVMLTIMSARVHPQAMWDNLSMWEFFFVIFLGGDLRPCHAVSIALSILIKQGQRTDLRTGTQSATIFKCLYALWLNLVGSLQLPLSVNE